MLRRAAAATTIFLLAQDYITAQPKFVFCSFMHTSKANKLETVLTYVSGVTPCVCRIRLRMLLLKTLELIRTLQLVF